MLNFFVYFRVIKRQNVPLMKCKEFSIICCCTGYSAVQRLKNVSCGLSLDFGRFSSVLLYMHFFFFWLIKITFRGHGKFTLQQLVANYWQIYASCCWVGTPVLCRGSRAESRFLSINVAVSYSDLKSVAGVGGLQERRLLVIINNMLSSDWRF